MTKLSEIAQSQPHAAYAAYIHGEQHRYTYFMRTICDISENLKPIDKVVEEKFLPALFGRDISEEERELLSLPVKEGGLGIQGISENASRNHWASKKITNPLIRQIVSQSDTLPSEEEVKKARTTTMGVISKEQKEKADNITSKQSSDQQRNLTQITEPGASSWLSAIPLRQYGFDLGRGEFQDALRLRYKMPLKNLPSKCPCGGQFNTTHALNCHKGGFINARHDNIRDLEAELMKSVCQDVEIEPVLQQVVNKNGYRGSANLADDARLDVRARGFWRAGQNAFFDVRITNADSESQRTNTVKSIMRKHENEKKAQYNQRVIQVEHGTFTPLIFTTSGAMGHECQKYHKTLAEKISAKNGERYEEVMRYIRVKISFLVLKSTLLCLRGSRVVKKTAEAGHDFSLCLNELNLTK